MFITMFITAMSWSCSVPTSNLHHCTLPYISLLTLNLPTTTIVAQPFNVIKWQVKFNPVA